MSGDYFGNQATLEVYHARVQRDLGSLVEEIYNLLRTCRNTTDADTLAAIETAENGSATGLLHTGNAVFNAIKILAIAVTYGNKSLALLLDLEECRVKTLTGLRDEVNHECSLLEVLYISSCINGTGIISGLVVGHYTMMITSYVLGEMAKTISDEIENAVNRIIFGIFDDGEEIFSRTDAADAKTAALRTAVNNFFIESMLFVHPTESCAINDAGKVLHDLTDEISLTYFLIIRTAQVKGIPNSIIIAKIDTLMNKIRDFSRKYVYVVFALIRNQEMWDDETETKFAIVKEKLNAECDIYFDHIQDLMEILAKAACENGVHADYISVIRNGRKLAISALDNYANLVSEAFMLSLLASKKT